MRPVTCIRSIVIILLITFSTLPVFVTPIMVDNATAEILPEGKIFVENGGAGKGALFTVRLPIEKRNNIDEKNNRKEYKAQGIVC